MRKILIGVLLGLLALLLVARLAWWRGDGKRHSVTLTWQAPPASEKFTVVGYNVYRGTTSGAQRTRIATRVPDPRYEDWLVDSGETYFYVVTSLDRASHESPFSTEVKVKVP